MYLHYFPNHFLTTKSGLRAKIKTRKQLYTVFLLTAEQRRWRLNVVIVQSHRREPLFILTSLTSRGSMYSLTYEQHYVPIDHYREFL